MRLLRSLSARWAQARAARLRRAQCAREVGHCWHPLGLVDWRCCECGAEVDGMPADRCQLCPDWRIVPFVDRLMHHGRPLEAWDADWRLR